MAKEKFVIWIRVKETTRPSNTYAVEIHKFADSFAKHSDVFSASYSNYNRPPTIHTSTDQHPGL